MQKVNYQEIGWGSEIRIRARTGEVKNNFSLSGLLFIVIFMFIVLSVFSLIENDYK